MNKPEEAEGYLRKILDGHVSAKPQDLAWARRATADILRRRGGYANLLQAVLLIDKNLASGSAVDDLREKAVLLAAFPQRAKRLEAIAALEQVVQSQRSEMADLRFKLAQLYLQEKDWNKAGEHIRALLTNHPKEVRFLAAYAALLMDRNEMQEAQLWLDRLQELAPENSSTITLQAEALVRQKQVDQAMELIRRFLGRPVDKPAERDARILQAASILKTIASSAANRGDKAAQTKLLKEMETLVRDYVTRHPAETYLLAFTLLQEGRVDEALEMAEQSWPKADVSALASEAQALIASSGLSPERIQRLERLLLSIADKRGRPVPLLLVIGYLQMRDQPQAATEIFREVLRKDENNVFALNNLAALLVLQKQDVEESLRLVERAIAIAGPIPVILDTRAAVRMAIGQREEAFADLDEALRDDPQPASYFHRALACWRLGQQRAATEAFRQARKLGLKPEGLVVLERGDYEELARSLPP